MQPNRASRRPIIEIDINKVVQGSDNPRTSTRQSSARTGQLQHGSLDSGLLDQRADKSHRAQDHSTLGHPTSNGHQIDHWHGAESNDRS